MFSLEKGPQLQRSGLSRRAENVRSHGLCHWQGKPGLNLFRESIQRPRGAQQRLKPRSTGERSSELEHRGFAVRTGQETNAQQEKLLEATSVPGVPGMPVPPVTAGVAGILTCVPLSCSLASPAAMAPKMRTMAASPAQQRSSPKEATRYAGATRTARASSGPPC